MSIQPQVAPGAASSVPEVAIQEPAAQYEDEEQDKTLAALREQHKKLEERLKESKALLQEAEEVGKGGNSK